jgi:hypothetical protein
VSIRPQKSVETIAALAAFEDTFIKAISVEYAVTPEDGLGGVFAWDETSVATVDNYNVVAHYTGTGRWLRTDQDNFAELRNNLSDVDNADVSLTNLGGNNYFGTKNSGAYWYFNGTTGLINVPDSAFYSFGDGTNNLPFTIAAWIRVDAGSGIFPVLGKVEQRVGGVTTVAPEYTFYLDADYKPVLFLEEPTTVTPIATVIGDVAVPTNEWVHVACVFEGSGPAYTESLATTGNAIKLYVNGELQETTVLNQNAVAMTSSVANLDVGKSFSNYSQGMVREVQLINYALSADYIYRLKSGSVDVITAYAGVTLIDYPSFLVEGVSYKINSFGVGDDFTNSGAASNDPGTIFVYNGTSPTWSNGSTLVVQGAVLDFRAEDTVINKIATRTFYSGEGTLTGGAQLIGWKSGQTYRSYTGDGDRKIIQLYGPTGDVFSVSESGAVTADSLVADSLVTPLSTGAAGSQTISGGVLTVAGSYYRMEPEGGNPGTDDLDTINGGTDGMRLILKTSDNTGDVTLKHNTGNILLQGDQDFELTDITWHIELLYDGLASKWIELTRRSDEVNIGVSE